MSTQAPTWAAPAYRNSSSRRWKKNWYLYFLLLVVAGYACLGRGFAYIGVAPLYIGEVCLAAGILTSFGKRARWRKTVRQPSALLLLLFMIWGAIRTIPFLDTYGVDALRDAVLWGYGLFALIVATRMIAREDYFGLVLHAFYKFSKFYLLACPLIWAYNVYLIQRMPHFFYGKTTRFEEVLVWLGAIAAIMFSRVFNYSPFWIILLCSDTILFFTGNRAGMLAFVCVVILCWLTNPFSRRLWLAAALAGITLLVLALLDVRIDMSHRELSIQQLVTNIESTFSSAQQSNEQGTKEWRLAWWRQIVDYTVFGEFFWGGKGFGVNLSDDDNHKLDYGRGPNQLRSPHSSHLSVLAREGVPGFLLWIIMNLTWALPLFYRLIRAKAAGRQRWAALILLLLSSWLGIFVIMSFGVVLEGPMMGIPFWTVYGMGIAVLYASKRMPYLLDGISGHMQVPAPVPSRPLRIPRDPVMARRLL